jgi:type VI secretion system protein ImpF
MSRVGAEQPLLPSLLDRLVDHEPDVSTEPAWRNVQRLRDYELSVLRDVEALLNTRQATTELPEGLPNLRTSVLTYGLPDFSAAGIGSPDEQEVLRRSVQDALERFEPRLQEVRVVLHPVSNVFDRTLRMTIYGMLRVEPDPVPITFDTVVHPSSGSCKVEAK